MSKGILAASMRILVGLLLITASSTATSKSPQPPDPDAVGTYTVILEDESTVQWHRQRNSTTSRAPGTGSRRAARKLRRPDFNSPEVRDFLASQQTRFETLRQSISRRLGRDLVPRKRFQHAINGFSASLTAAEAELLKLEPGVRSVRPTRKFRPLTDAGPQWIGADDIWNGLGALPARRGEGIIIGVIDTGINTSHISFSDPGGSGGAHDFTNPLGSFVGTCSEPEITCNDKLIGVWDFVEDDPGTEFVEENTKGEDVEGHGSNVASIAAGNTLQLNNNGIIFGASGVAPNANIISYRVCYEPDPQEPDLGTCQGDAIIDAVDQAILDGVDVLNLSLGSSSGFSPWDSASELAFLEAVDAGIFVATSAGNEGPSPGSLGDEAQAPWMTGVANSSHNRLFGALLENLVGGNTPPPGDMFGATQTDASGFRKIVHAKDFGNALCGTGTEELGASCNDNTGATNPFEPGTFNGEIVVCDRGQYGRIEKGKNLQLAGAGGMILANTEEDGEELRSDEHCIPSIHLGRNDSDDLRTWLDSGDGHMGSISGFDRILSNDLADILANSSSRGPGLSFVDRVLAPNLTAPGQNILGAWAGNNAFAAPSGTSMSSPHIAGAAALLLAVDDNWTPAMISSTLEMTADATTITDFDGSVATPHERGAGRPVLVNAANSGLFLDETTSNFIEANPALDGKPGKLNLSGLVDPACKGTCTFTRTVTDLVGGESWGTFVSGFPQGVEVSVTPSAFFLGSGASRTLTIDIDLRNAPVIGSWVYGDVFLTSAGRPSAKFTVAVFADGGELPLEWEIFSDQDSGWQEFSLDNLAPMPNATFNAGGLVRPGVDSALLPQDPSRSNPYDGGAGVLVKLVEVPEGTLWLHTATLQSTALDVDLYVGRDSNGDGEPELDEELCSSTTPQDLELCDFLRPVPGNYWILAQNWRGSGGNDEVFLETAVITGDDGQRLSATGPGIIGEGDSFDLRLSWSNAAATDGEQLLGAVGVGTHGDQAANIGVIPVYFNRQGIAAPATMPLFNGLEREFTLDGGTTHNRAFIDVPQGASQLTVTASAADAGHNDSLEIELRRLDLVSAFASAPFAVPSPGGAAIASASGSGGQGPQVSVSGASLEPGRWYVDFINAGPGESAVTATAEVSFEGDPLEVNGHLWISENRPGISQGIDYQPIGPFRGLIWYTFADNHDPAWYLSAGLAPSGNIWTAPLQRYTNDGGKDQYVTVGTVSMTQIDTDDAVMTWELFGKSGSERMNILGGTGNPCPTVNEQQLSLSGFWGKAVPGLGGASVLFIDAAHAEIHYLYDARGNPAWLEAGAAEGNDLTFRQYTGNCATCNADPISSQATGTLTHDYQSEGAAQWIYDYLLVPPLSGDVERTDTDVIRLSDIRACD